MKPLRECDIVAYSLSGKNIPIDRIFATYTCKDNWEQNYDELKVRWVWKGPWSCAYEFARNQFKNKKQIEEKRLIGGDIMRFCANREKIPIEDILATYASENNWKQIEKNGRCYFVWIGPWICGYDGPVLMNLRF